MKILMTLIVSMAWLSSLNAATYSFHGSQYQTVYGDNYTTQMRVTGHMVTSQALAPNTSTTQVLPLIESYSFSDGVKTLTQNNSQITYFQMIVGNDGLPYNWNFSITQTPFADELGEPYHVIYFSYWYNTEGTDEYQGGYGELCTELGPGSCIRGNNLINAGSYMALPSFNRDQWSLVGGIGVQAVPINQYQFLGLFSLLVLLIAFYVLKRNHGNNF